MLEWMSGLDLCVDDIGMAGGVGRRTFFRSASSEESRVLVVDVGVSKLLLAAVKPAQ